MIISDSQYHDPLESVQSHLDTYVAGHPETGSDDTDILRPKHKLWHIVGTGALVAAGAAVVAVEVIKHVNKRGDR